MIIRIWHGYTDPEQADPYQQLLLEEIFPGIESKGIPGYQGIELLRRDLGDEVEFITIMRFQSWKSIETLSGGGSEAAYVPASARRLLKRFDTVSQHYEQQTSITY